VSPRSSRKVVLAGFAADVAIAVCKYVAAAMTSSPSMFSEAMHSTADTGNELLSLLGMRRSRRPPDALHPFGHGKVLYFYSLLVAVYIFAVGGGLAAYEGIHHLLHPETSVPVGWSYAVLAISAVLISTRGVWHIAKFSPEKIPTNPPGTRSSAVKIRPSLQFFWWIRLPSSGSHRFLGHFLGTRFTQFVL